MKIFKSAILLLTTVVTFLSCQKELAFDNNGVSTGTFKKDAGGDCLPVTVTGLFKVDTALTNAVFVDVQVNVTTPGTFEIKSDTINGFSFSRSGLVIFGTNTIRLYGSGKPLAAGTNTFTIKYGTSTCTFDITVISSGTGTAVFTLGSTGGICTGATPGGTYTVGVPLTPANTLTVTVTVTTPGTYSIGAVTGIGGGFIFTGTGVFNNTGTQNVTLTGSGTPITAGLQTVTVLNAALSTCTYAVTVLTGTGGGGGGGGTGGSSQYYFQFNDGAKLIAADTSAVIAMSLSLGGLTQLSVQAFSVTGDSALQIGVAATGSPVVGVTYKTSNIGVPLSVFSVLSTLNGQVYMADLTTTGKNIDIKFDVIDTVNKIVSGTFSGTANGISTGATITNGKFRAQLQ